MLKARKKFVPLAVLAALLSMAPASAQYAYREGYNPYTGTRADDAAVRNPYTGTARGEQTSYNRYTGTRDQSKEVYNPYTGRSAEVNRSYNPYTGRSTVQYGYRR